MNKKTISILIYLAFLSLACLQTAIVANDLTPGAESISTSTFRPISGSATVQNLPSASPTEPFFTCAQVIASKALNLRKGASEHTQIITWLRNGDQVRVISVDGDWWMIDAGGTIGYVRSMYLAQGDCLK